MLGLSYTDGLLQELQTKRDNHRIAEQGRRTRMKKALQALDELLSQDSVAVRNGGNSVGHAGARSRSSDKVAIVEKAVEHIKSLQRELEEMKSMQWEREPQEIHS